MFLFKPTFAKISGWKILLNSKFQQLTLNKNLKFSIQTEGIQLRNRSKKQPSMDIT